MEKHRAPKNNAKRSAAEPNAAASGKHRAKNKSPIKVVYIANPMRFTAAAADFRALVQELTGRHADPSKYADLDASGATTLPQLSPASTTTSPDTAAGPSADAAAPNDEEEYDDAAFTPLLLDNSCSMFSLPTLP